MVAKIDVSLIEKIVDEDVRGLLFESIKYPLGSGLATTDSGYHFVNVDQAIPGGKEIEREAAPAYATLSRLLESEVYRITAEALESWGGKFALKGQTAFGKHLEISQSN